MEKQILIDLINQNLNIRDIANILGKAPSTITYWLNKYGLKTNFLSFKDRDKVEYGDKRTCSKCKCEKELDNFYNRGNKIGGSVYCKECMNKQALDRQRKLKQEAIDYKGGSCQICGYNRCNGALEFHHLDPNEKDFSISELKKTNMNEKIKLELDKCILVCANCHREIHAGLLNL